MAESSSVGLPPAFEIHTVDLVSVEQSKILGVSVYAGRAEITRSYKFDVNTGQNQVTITGLPRVMDKQSIRVEGRGAATIQDVTLSDMPTPPVISTSQTLNDMIKKQTWTGKAYERYQNSVNALETFIGTVNVAKIAPSQLSGILHNYEAEAEKLDSKVLDIKQELDCLQEQIREERDKLAIPRGDPRLGLQASLGIFSESSGEIEIILTYAVSDANWAARYDIRVDMNTKEKPVTLVYKAAITQDTGESWDDVSLTLETATPTFGVDMPKLDPWHLSVPKPATEPKKRLSVFGSASSYTPPPMIVHTPPATVPPPLPAQVMIHRQADVTSKGTVSATYRVPGIISVPSDGHAHNVTIVELTLNASMSWIAVPKEDPRTHLKASIKNASDFTFLPGIASVYVDGSFISKSTVPAVNPQESFDCPLGLDPSLRLTYHPRSKKVSQSGFYQKISSHVYLQRITIFNAKSIQVDKLQIIDQVPVSEDSDVRVNLVSPPLSLQHAAKPVPVSDGVVAQWESTDQARMDESALGADGKLSWLCSIKPQEKINLLLQWEVTSPTNQTVVGL